MWRIFSLIAKSAVSALLLYLALGRVNLEMVGARLSQVNLGWLGLELVVLAIQITLLAARWREIVDQCGAAVPYPRIFHFSMIGMFFNQTLPSSVGGDAARIWLLARGGAGWRIAAYSVLIDRVVGVIALAVLVIACLPWTLALVRDPIGRAALLVIGFGSIAAGAVFILLGSARLGFLQRWAPTRHLAAAAADMTRLFRCPRSGALVAGLSLLIHFFTVAAAWCAAKAIAAPLDFTQALFLVLPVVLITIVPISIAGWGVRESAMIMAFGYAGLAAGDGLIVSLLFGAGSFIIGAIGGLMWIFGSDRGSTTILSSSETIGGS